MVASLVLLVLLDDRLVEHHAHALQVTIPGFAEGQKAQGVQAPHDRAYGGLAHIEDGCDVTEFDDIGFGLQEQIQDAALVVVESVGDLGAA